MLDTFALTNTITLLGAFATALQSLAQPIYKKIYLYTVSSIHSAHVHFTWNDINGSS